MPQTKSASEAGDWGSVLSDSRRSHGPIEGRGILLDPNPLPLPYTDRNHAGRVLAEQMTGYKSRCDLLILGLPRGGVPVAYEVAQALQAPLDVMIVRKLGFPGQEEFAMGAIATGDVTILNPDLDAMSCDIIHAAIQQEKQELQRRERAYRGDRVVPQMKDRCVILVDDGLATGSTMQAAAKAVRQQNPSRVVVAVPVAPSSTLATLKQQVDEVVCPTIPLSFRAVGQWYQNFNQTTDNEVCQLLQRAWETSSNTID